MPINGILDLQRRDAPLGEIRIGTSVEVPETGKRRPVRLETFRFTTASEHNARQVADAALSGGDGRVEWADGGAERDASRIAQEIDAVLARALAAPPPCPSEETLHG